MPVRLLTPADVDDVGRLNAVFAAAFDDPATYTGAPPDDAYIARLLADPGNVVLVAEAGGEIVGGLIAYQLDKFEQARSELYIYDLAVLERCRCQGIATRLITHLQQIAAARGAWWSTSKPTMATIRRSPSTRNLACARR